MNGFGDQISLFRIYSNYAGLKDYVLLVPKVVPKVVSFPRQGFVNIHRPTLRVEVGDFLHHVVKSDYKVYLFLLGIRLLLNINTISFMSFRVSDVFNLL